MKKFSWRQWLGLLVVVTVVFVCAKWWLSYRRANNLLEETTVVAVRLNANFKTVKSLIEEIDAQPKDSFPEDLVTTAKNQLREAEKLLKDADKKYTSIEQRSADFSETTLLRQLLASQRQQVMKEQRKQLDKVKVSLTMDEIFTEVKRLAPKFKTSDQNCTKALAKLQAVLDKDGTPPPSPTLRKEAESAMKEAAALAEEARGSIKKIREQGETLPPVFQEHQCSLLQKLDEQIENIDENIRVIKGVLDFKSRSGIP